VAAVAPVFQASSGGRQQRDLTLTYPALQDSLDRVPLWLVLILDGRGIAEAPDRVLLELIDSVAACMTLRQAEGGDLHATLVDAAASGGLRHGTIKPLERVIASTLESRDTISASDLPVSREGARLALARYIEQHPELALDLHPAGESLGWSRKSQVAAALELTEQYSPQRALDVFLNLLGVAKSRERLDIDDETLIADMVRGRGDAILPDELLVTAAAEDFAPEVARRVANAAFHRTPDASIALLLAPSWGESETSLHLQRPLPASVVVLTPGDLLGMARGSMPPRDGLAQHILKQADLTKGCALRRQRSHPLKSFLRTGGRGSKRCFDCRDEFGRASRRSKNRKDLTHETC
jgi:hypothetical protein